MRALDGVSFTLRARARSTRLCGENGAGKSTLIKIAVRRLPRRHLRRRDPARRRAGALPSLRDAEHHGIALIAQELALVPELSVEENLALGREPVRAGLIRWDVVREQAKAALQMVGLDVDPAAPVKELGIGQQQLVEIAKALAKKRAHPRPRRADRGAHRGRRRAPLRLLAELRARGVSCIYISHRLEEVFADRRPHHRAARRPLRGRRTRARS